MTRRPTWKYTLAEARRQALVAVDFYNRPGDRRSFSDFIIHMHLAWQNLLHADLMRKEVEIDYRESNGRRFKRNPDNSKKTWDLSKCLREEFDNNDPIRKNIEFFIGLRNRVEHRFEKIILNSTAAEAHAYIINFETELVNRFGVDESLSNELKFPIFVQSLNPSNYEEQRRLRRKLPKETSTFIAKFQNDLSDEIRSDKRFAYRLLLLPMKGPKTEADLALNFVRQDELTEDEQQALLGKEGSIIIAEKYRNVAYGEEMRPKAAAKAVEKLIDFKFSINDFTKVRKKWEIGPIKSGSDKELPKSNGYCLYSPAFNSFLYKPKLIERMTKELNTREKYEKLVEHPAIEKTHS